MTVWPSNPDDEVLAPHRPRGRAPEHHPPADRQRELHLAGGAARHRLGAHQQVQRGLPGQALLRRQRGHRRGRGPRPRAGQGAVRRRARQRAAPRRAPTPTWPSTSRCSSRATPCSACGSTRAATSPTARRSTPAAGSTTSCPTASRRATSASTSTRCATLALEHRPKIIVTGATAYPRIIDSGAVPRHRRRGRRAVHVRRRPHRRPHRRRAAPEPGGRTAPTS